MSEEQLVPAWAVGVTAAVLVYGALRMISLLKDMRETIQRIENVLLDHAGRAARVVR